MVNLELNIQIIHGKWMVDRIILLLRQLWVKYMLLDVLALTTDNNIYAWGYGDMLALGNGVLAVEKVSSSMFSSIELFYSF